MTYCRKPIRTTYAGFTMRS